MSSPNTPLLTVIMAAMKRTRIQSPSHTGQQTHIAHAESSEMVWLTTKGLSLKRNITGDLLGFHIERSFPREVKLLMF
jgi:hypothetical protein